MSDSNCHLATLDAMACGHVQGVYFRVFTARYAAQLGLTGYVRNTGAGDVEVHAEGDREQLLKLVGRLKAGPSAAHVGEVCQRWSEFTGTYRGFEISYRP